MTTGPAEMHGMPASAWRWGGLLVGLVVALLATVAPASVIAWLRESLPWLAAVWDALILSIPGSNLPHVVFYALLGSLWLALTPMRRHGPWLVLLALFCSLSEAIQLLVPGRTARFSDVANDLLGLAVALVIVRLSHWWARRHAIDGASP